MLRTFIDTINVEDSRWRHRTWTKARTKFVRPSTGGGVGEFVLQVCGDEQGAQVEAAEQKSHRGQRKRRRALRPDQANRRS